MLGVGYFNQATKYHRGCHTIQQREECVGQVGHFIPTKMLGRTIHVGKKKKRERKISMHYTKFSSLDSIAKKKILV